MYAPGAQQYERSGRYVTAAVVDPLQTAAVLFSLDDWSHQRTVVKTFVDRRALLRDLIWFRDGTSGDAEVEALAVIEGRRRRAHRASPRFRAGRHGRRAGRAVRQRPADR